MYHQYFVSIDGVSTSILVDLNITDAQEDTRPICFVLGLASHYVGKFSNEFSSAYRMVFLDLYWTGDQFSETYIQELTIDKISAHIHLIQRKLSNDFGTSYERVFVAAHSAYGLIALAYANRYTHHVNGVIAIGTPPNFNANYLLKEQEAYLENNLEKSRCNDYLNAKNEFSKRKPDSSKKYFADWYTSMAPLLWKKEPLWKNINNQTLNLWDPWKVVVKNSQGQQQEQVFDINMCMLNHFFKLLAETDWRSELNKVSIPVLWFIGLYDSRVSLYVIEDSQKQGVFSSMIEFHYLDAGHWPMFKLDGDCTDFDTKAVSWGKTVSEKYSFKSLGVL